MQDKKAIQKQIDNAKRIRDIAIRNQITHSKYWKGILDALEWVLNETHDTIYGFVQDETEKDGV